MQGAGAGDLPARGAPVEAAQPDSAGGERERQDGAGAAVRGAVGAAAVRDVAEAAGEEAEAGAAERGGGAGGQGEGAEGGAGGAGGAGGEGAPPPRRPAQRQRAVRQGDARSVRERGPHRQQ